MTPEPLYSPLTIDRTGRIYLCGMAGYCWGVAPDGTVLWHITMWGWQNENGQGLRGSRTAPLIVADGKMLSSMSLVCFARMRRMVPVWCEETFSATHHLAVESAEPSALRIGDRCPL